MNKLKYCTSCKVVFYTNDDFCDKCSNNKCSNIEYGAAVRLEVVPKR